MATRERPILFSGPMVRAILEGRKTQTRRIVLGPACRYGQPGDRLWVREAWRPFMAACRSGIEFLADGGHKNTVGENFERLCDLMMRSGGVVQAPGMSLRHRLNWRPSIHMPRWASRLTLEITDVRAERLQSISEDDAKAEGARCWICNGPVDGTGENDCACFHAKAAARDSFQALWDRINGKRAPWADNPYVWAITFRRVES